MKILSRYDDKTPGTYVSVRPIHSASIYIDSLIRGYGFNEPTEPLDQHCTIVYSPEGTLSLVERRQVWIDGFDPLRRFRARPKQIVKWDGQDGKGVLVLLLDSPDLREVNRYLTTRYSLPSTFPDYQPHVTLADNINEFDEEAVAEALSYVADDLVLTFAGLHLEDLS